LYLVIEAYKLAGKNIDHDNMPLSAFIDVLDRRGGCHTLTSGGDADCQEQPGERP